MISGINTDIEFEGNVYHIQTEDGGTKNPSVVTHLFLSGAILSSEKTSYADKSPQEDLVEYVKGLMKNQHRSMIKILISGKFQQGSHPVSTTVKKEVVQSPTPVDDGKMGNGPPSKNSERKSLDDLIIEYLSSTKSEE